MDAQQDGMIEKGHTMTSQEQLDVYTAYHNTQMPRWQIYRWCPGSHCLWGSWAALVN